jgi:hypothetical protein
MDAARQAQSIRDIVLSSPTSCPLCAGTAGAFHRGGHGEFWACPTCDLVFRDASEHLDMGAQLERYREHRNSLEDPRYLDFLDRLAAPLAARLRPGARGLDYGCGPVAGMAALLEPRGFPTASWDPLFRPDASALTGPYDFIICSEVLEHILDPKATLDRLASLLAPGGLIGFMTQFRRDAAHFAGWHYHRDPTHVCFYSPATMRWIGARRGWEVEIPADGVTFFRTLPG